jgi:hypothetical protein
MIMEMRSIKSPDQMPEFFTNESAAAMGMVMMIPVAMMAAFEDMGSQMGAQLGKLGGQGQATQTPPASQTPKVKAELEATLKKYGISQDVKPDDKQAMAAVTSRGREFFRDMMGLLTKLDKKGGSGFNMDPKKGPDPEDATYEVLGPTRVKITQKNPKDKMLENAEARFEDGRWRLHIGGFEELMKQAGPAMGGMPGGPGGMGMPSGPGAGAPR